ncbi:MAG TPA: ATP-binding protein, partial [Thermomicrobiales bacterium]
MVDQSAPAAPAPKSPALVGRDRELTVLHEALASALAGCGALVLIGGEAGIGKTALAEALCRDAAEQGARVLIGRCYDLGETPPYGPWAEALGYTSAYADVPALPA